MKEYLRIKPKDHDTRLFCDLTYSNGFGGELPGPALNFHLILPTDTADTQFPLLIYIGGGGWRTSKPERHLPELNFFAQNGFAVASIQYRTTETSTFPAPIENVRTAIRYFRSHAKDLHIDPEHIFVMGGSAGGYLAAMAALLADQPSFQGQENLETSDRVSGAICLYGIFDFPMYLKSCGEDSEKALPIHLFVPNHDEQALQQASATTYVTEKTVPFLLLHGTADFTVPCEQSSYFHDLLVQAGSSAALYLVNYAKHASEEFGCREIQKVELGFMEQILRKDHKNCTNTNNKQLYY